MKVNTAAHKTTVDEQHYICWTETSKRHYYELTELLFCERGLHNVNFLCENNFCNIKEHREHIDRLCDNIVKVLQDASILLLNECNTATMAKHSGIQWDNNLQELKRQSININNLWKEMG